jgi:glutamate 5-kinase
MKIVIKVGSALITNVDGKLNSKLLLNLTDQISALMQEHDVVLVSSGASSAGRSHFIDQIKEPQTLAAVGQIPLMQKYSQLFAKNTIICGQVLVTKSDFRDRTHYLNMRNCIDSLLKNKVIPIVNENDVVSLESLRFTDNDELAGLIAAMINADLVIILTSVEGLMDNSKKLIRQIAPNDINWQAYIKTEKTLTGRGGMLTKATVAQRLANLGIKTIIANGNLKNILKLVINQQRIGTEFLPLKRSAAAKRWLSQAAGNEKAIVYINQGAANVLIDQTKAASLLPIGITKIEGTFNKNDVLKVVDEASKLLGIGKAQYGASSARKYLGKQNKKPLIHRDYLWIE